MNMDAKNTDLNLFDNNVKCNFIQTLDGATSETLLVVKPTVQLNTTATKPVITGAITTCHNKDDRSQVKALLKGIKTKEVIADPGYDGENIYQMLRAKGIKPTIRPPNQLVTRKAKTERQLRINKPQDIMHGGIRTNMDVS